MRTPIITAESVKLPSLPIGFDIGGVVTDAAARDNPFSHWLDDEFFYLETPENDGFREQLWRLVNERFRPQDIHFVSKCDSDTARRSQEYLAGKGLHADLGIPLENLHFTSTREGKVPIIRALGLRAFTDDRAEVITSLEGIVPYRLLFKPDAAEAAQFKGDEPGITTVFRWKRLADHLLALPSF